MFFAIILIVPFVNFLYADEQAKSETTDDTFKGQARGNNQLENVSALTVAVKEKNKWKNY